MPFFFSLHLFFKGRNVQNKAPGHLVAVNRPIPIYQNSYLAARLG